jgi:hypothetical protein
MSTQRALRTSMVALVVLLSGAAGAGAYVGFGKPTNMESIIPVLDGKIDAIDCFSDDGLELYISTTRPGGQGNTDIWVLRRATSDSAWTDPVNLGPAVNGPGNELLSSLSADGLTLYFCSDRPHGDDNRYDLFVTKRATKKDPWGTAVNLGTTINSLATDAAPWISRDGLELYFVSYRPGGSGHGDIYVSKRATKKDPWATTANLGTVVNSAYNEQCPSLSSDGLVLLFANGDYTLSALPYGEYGVEDLWMTKRASLSAPWQAPVNLGLQVNGSAHGLLPRLAPDGHTLYFASQRGGTWANWQSSIVPIVDFTGDGAVDENDDLVLADGWGGDDPLCDIGPSPWGDGTVNAKDLTVLDEYRGKQVTDPTLLAHWALDEKEGTVAHDNAGQNDALTVGGPTWQPGNGIVGGALAFDGVDDCLLAKPLVGLSKGPFSILAWVKGGAPNQIVIGQQNGPIWLGASYGDGCLWTEGDEEGAHTSKAQITDGAWHRIGVVWDGVNEILYVDGREVARYGTSLSAYDSSLIVIGGGPWAGTFWSGLIDDVRIYSRVVRPLTTGARHISRPRGQ